jgi:hypothetical protein
LQPPLEEAQEENADTTAIASTKIKIDFFISEVFKIKINCLDDRGIGAR